MIKRRAIFAIGATVMSLGLLPSLATPAFAWVGGAGDLNVTQTWDGFHVPTLDVEGSDSIENVKQKIQDKTGMSPACMRLTFGIGFEQVVLQDGNVINDYPYIYPGDVIELWMLPVVAAWSITPDEPYLGGTVSNAVIAHPGVTHASVVSGSLPDGVTLDSDTGQVLGTFAEPGAFDVTIAADTVCGSAQISWSGVVPGTLADTGLNQPTIIASLIASGLLVSTGAALALLRRRHAQTS
ncbi:unannotated protein [freshwater metagenome]|uniref:Unannotated protein n=1 Tax=freshwater metagenome TaxID=449393 RepID=A0A6J6CV30_9ZZZZ|nr:hypothetical protein [Actinomycetota bacterium]